MGVVRTNNRYWKPDNSKKSLSVDNQLIINNLSTLDNKYENIIKDKKLYDNHLDQMIIKVFENERDLKHLKLALSRTKSDSNTNIGYSITRCPSCNTFLTNYKSLRDFDCEICQKEYDINNYPNKKIKKCKKCDTIVLKKDIKVYCHNNNYYKPSSSIFGGDDGW